MFPGTTYLIREATARDADSLLRLAVLDSQPRLHGRVLIGEMHGAPAAALSLADGRVVADPFLHTRELRAALHLRARTVRAAEGGASLHERIRAGIRVDRPAGAAA